MKCNFLSIQCFAVFLIIINIPLIQSCTNDAGASDTTAVQKEDNVALMPMLLSDQFKNYWYAGKAEICSYHLKQARYGEIHDGSAVTIFVTEDFSKAKQVKLDHPETAGDDRLPVLKLNLVKKFVTGIYPYSMMMSAFSPVDIVNYPHAIKIAASVQEWCGSTYTQLNNRNGKYLVTWNSYFEDEGDKNVTFEKCFLEDELWNLIRITPDHLPVGEQKVLPGSLYTRMTHIPLNVENAVLALKANGDTMLYTINYKTQQHIIDIKFEKSFPHKILGWDETFPGFDGKLLTTIATLDKTIMTNYWTHHNNADRSLRSQLGIPENF
ncbi:MAG: hypothetical protein H0W62_02600 [Chitinophagales bacterium]|nr:hypothetical protein [Chitinophagales bacterium]